MLTVCTQQISKNGRFSGYHNAYGVRAEENQPLYAQKKDPFHDILLCILHTSAWPSHRHRHPPTTVVYCVNFHSTLLIVWQVNSNKHPLQSATYWLFLEGLCIFDYYHIFNQQFDEGEDVSVIQWPIVHVRKRMQRSHWKADWLHQHKHGISSWKKRTQYLLSKPTALSCRVVSIQSNPVKIFCSCCRMAWRTKRCLCICIYVSWAENANTNTHARASSSIASTNKSYYLICIFSEVPHQIFTMAPNGGAASFNIHVLWVCVCVCTVHIVLGNRIKMNQLSPLLIY